MKYKFTALKTGLLISLLMGCACCNLRRNTVEQIQIIPADTVKSLFSNHESNDTPVEKKMRDQGLVDIAEQVSRSPCACSMRHPTTSWANGSITD